MDISSSAFGGPFMGGGTGVISLNGLTGILTWQQVLAAQTYQINDSANDLSVDVENRQLWNGDGQFYLDWSAQETYDADQSISMNWASRQLFNALGVVVLNWSTQQTVTGSRATGAALVSLLNALANFGLIINNTTA